MDRPLPARSADGRDVRPQDTALDGAGLVGAAGEIATGRVTDRGAVTEAWTGPQVAWKMARGSPGAFGGKLLTSWPVWLGLSAVFLLGLIDLRRPFTLSTLDLLVLLSFGVSLVFFNRGEVFQSAALAVPPLAYLLARTAWIGFRREARPHLPVPRWPVWALVGATLFLVGFRVGLDVENPRTVIDVGYAGVIGADRIVDGRIPYGTMPTEEGKPCGPAASDGEIRDRIQANGRCESANPSGDTYGPFAYLAYVPARRDARLEREVGPTFRRRTRPRSRSTCSCCSA